MKSTTEKPLDLAVRVKSSHNLAELTELNITELSTKVINTEEGSTGWRLLHQAADEGHIKMVHKLLNAGADVNIAENNGGTPLHCAAHRGHLNVVNALFHARVDVNRVNKWGWSALHFACMQGHKAVVKALISAGADINRATNEGTAPILLCSSKGYLDIVSALIGGGADVNVATNDGYSPLFAATREEKYEVVVELLAAGADGTMASNFFSNCTDEFRVRILNTLIEHGGSIGNITKFLSSFKDIRMKKLFLTTSNFPIHALALNGYRLWLYIMQQLNFEGLEELVEGYVEKYPDLLYVLDSSGHFAVNKALPAYKSILQAHMSLWHGRYLVTERRPIYISSTCVVYKAADHSLRDKQGKPTVIALKLMKYKSQYVKEIGMRKQMEIIGGQKASHANSGNIGSAGDNSAFVISVLSSHAPRNNKESSDENMDLSELLNYGSCDTGKLLTAATSPVKSGEKHRDNKFSKYMDGLRRTDSRLARANEERLQRIQSFNALKYNAEKLFCISMPFAEANLQSVMKQERFMIKSITEVKSIFLQILRCVDFIHSKGLVHGDLKPMNIVFESSFGWKVLDLDSCSRVGIDSIGFKASSAYLPPEMVYTYISPSTKKKEAIVRYVTNLISAGLDLSHVLSAQASYDVWSLGCILYQLCNEKCRPLFQGDLDDNLTVNADGGSVDSLLTLAEWSDETKAAKLASVKNSLARNLLEQMLVKEPTKRAPLCRILAHPFLTDKRPKRLIGDRPEFDVYISYRQASDAHHAGKLYALLTAKGLKVWWDKVCIQEFSLRDTSDHGHNINSGFMNGLVNCKVYMPLISRNSINNPTIEELNFGKLTPDSHCDDLLLEYRLAAELKDLNMIEGVYPVFIGDQNGVSKTGTPLYSDIVTNIPTNPKGWTAAHILPRVSEISVSAVEAEIQHYMESQCLNSLLIPERSISSIVSFIARNTYAADGAAATDAAPKINEKSTISSATSPTTKSSSAVPVAAIVGDGDIAFHRLVENVCKLLRSEVEAVPMPTLLKRDSEIGPTGNTRMVDKESMTDLTLDQRSSVVFSSSFDGDGDGDAIGFGGSKSSSLSSSKQSIQRAQLLDKDISLVGLESENAMLREEIILLKSSLTQIQQQHSAASTPMRSNLPSLEAIRSRTFSSRELIPISEDMSSVDKRLSAEIELLRADLHSMVLKNKSLKSKITQVKEEVDSLDRDKRVLQFENSLMKQELTKLKEQLANQAEQFINSVERK